MFNAAAASATTSYRIHLGFYKLQAGDGTPSPRHHACALPNEGGELGRCRLAHSSGTCSHQKISFLHKPHASAKKGFYKKCSICDTQHNAPNS